MIDQKINIPHSFHTFLCAFSVRTNITIYTLITFRSQRGANFLAKTNEKMVNFAPKFQWQPVLQALPCIFRIFSFLLHPSQPVADPVNVGIHPNS